MTNLRAGLAALFVCSATILSAAQRTKTRHYLDNRHVPTLRYDAVDQGIVLRPGGCPNDCDKYGARDGWAFEHKGRFYMHYDAAGASGWLTLLAVSNNFEH